LSSLHDLIFHSSIDAIFVVSHIIQWGFFECPSYYWTSQAEESGTPPVKVDLKRFGPLVSQQTCRLNTLQVKLTHIKSDAENVLCWSTWIPGIFMITIHSCTEMYLGVLVNYSSEISLQFFVCLVYKLIFLLYPINKDHTDWGWRIWWEKGKETYRKASIIQNTFSATFHHQLSLHSHGWLVWHAAAVASTATLLYSSLDLASNIIHLSHITLPLSELCESVWKVSWSLWLLIVTM
jgi:hypothetical protein